MNWRDTVMYPQSADTLSSDEIVSYCKAWRNRQLSDSDWTQLADVPLANKVAWATYRQELRDLPSQGNDPKLWVFPTRP